MPALRPVEVLILGLDPGSRHTGFGFVRMTGQQLTVVADGRLSLEPKAPLHERLAALASELDQLLATFSPDAVVLESLFHGINVRSLIVLAQARGAILALLGQRQIPTYEYAPAEVKRALTGNGRADKDQVARIVDLQLALGPKVRPHDTTDALALAICYAQRHRFDRLGAALP